jgi:8-oxo-dGTP pyrophosphatase MutT (NUDIX family)
MHRNLLLNLLENYQPVDPNEIEARARMLGFVKTNPNCFDRELLQGHITASAWLLNKDQTKALLLHHAKLNVWCQLGGHCDGDSNVLQVAIKEAQEESGINGIEPLSTDIFDIDIHAIPEYNNIPAHYHYDVRFLLQVQSDEKVIGNNESKDIRWFALDSQLPTNAESIHRMFRKWQAFQKKKLVKVLVS